MASLQLPIYDSKTFCIIGYTPAFEDEFKFKELNQYKWYRQEGKFYATNDEGKTIYFDPAPPITQTPIKEEEEEEEEYEIPANLRERFMYSKNYKKK